MKSKWNPVKSSEIKWNQIEIKWSHGLSEVVGPCGPIHDTYIADLCVMDSEVRSKWDRSEIEVTHRSEIEVRSPHPTILLSNVSLLYLYFHITKHFVIYTYTLIHTNILTYTYSVAWLDSVLGWSTHVIKRFWTAGGWCQWRWSVGSSTCKTCQGAIPIANAGCSILGWSCRWQFIARDSPKSQLHKTSCRHLWKSFLVCWHRQYCLAACVGELFWQEV